MAKKSKGARNYSIHQRVNVQIQLCNGFKQMVCITGHIFPSHNGQGENICFTAAAAKADSLSILLDFYMTERGTKLAYPVLYFS